MEKIPKIIITDTHFGRYNNSANFLKSQLYAFEDLKKYIKKCGVDRFDLIHLGDIFESRSTISTSISEEVRKLFKELNALIKSRNPENRLIFVAGNHDFYSPTSDVINSLDTYIRDWVPDAIVVSRECFEDGDDIYIPWYWMNDPEKFLQLDLAQYHRIFTHCDCKEFAWGKIPVNTTLYAGHIHQCKHYDNAYSSNPDSILYNLSPPYSLDFGDSNNFDKGFWVVEDKKPSLYKNKKSIRYRTFINEQIFDIEDLEESIERGDNFRIFISDENRSKYNYIERINELSTDLRYLDIIIMSTSVNDLNEEALDFVNVESMLEGMIPEHLKDKFIVIKNEINN